MFLPNTFAEVREVVDVSAQGEPTFGSPWKAAIGIVRLTPAVQRTSVRADSSASRGSADEMTAAAVILFDKGRRPNHGDVVTVQGMNFSIIGVEPRLTVGGKLDHYQVALEHWGKL